MFPLLGACNRVKIFTDRELRQWVCIVKITESHKIMLNEKAFMEYRLESGICETLYVLFFVFMNYTGKGVM